MVLGGYIILHRIVGWSCLSNVIEQKLLRQEGYYIVGSPPVQGGKLACTQRQTVSSIKLFLIYWLLFSFAHERLIYWTVCTLKAIQVNYFAITSCVPQTFLRGAGGSQYPNFTDCMGLASGKNDGRGSSYILR